MRSSAARPVAVLLLPIMTVVFASFLVIGMAFPVLPLHVHQGLGLSTFVVGVITGSQFIAAVISRIAAGNYADGHGAKRAVIVGLITGIAGGLLYLASLRFISAPGLSAAILLLGRTLLGVAESFIITSGLAWGLALVGPASAGQVIAWVGMAMFAAFAAGPPLGTILYESYGFSGIAIATILIPLATVPLVASLGAVPPRRSGRSHLRTVMRTVWMPGMGSALSSIGFGTMIAFSSLLSVERGWAPVWILFTAFATALVAARLLFGHLPDKHGGALVGGISAAVEAIGLATIWLAPNLTLATIGALLTGFGYALVYPSLGAEAVRRVPPESRGLAMGAYSTFLDIALGFGSPALGLLAGIGGLSSIFVASAVLVLGTMLFAARLGFGTVPRR